MAVDLDIVEQELRRIPEVRAARIVTDNVGVPIEVHVLATLGKHAKQLVRDVQSVAIASQGLEIDHRIVSVVQLEDATGAASDEPARPSQTPEGPEGPSLGGITVDRQELSCSVTVRLCKGEMTVDGTATGSSAASAARRAVAEATLAALVQLDPAISRTSVEAVSQVRVGECDIMVTVLSAMVPPYEELLTGSAPVRSAGPDDAIVRAVLDACGRRAAHPG